jgi:hypothetical protein
MFFSNLIFIFFSPSLKCSKHFISEYQFQFFNVAFFAVISIFMTNYEKWLLLLDCKYKELSFSDCSPVVDFINVKKHESYVQKLIQSQILSRKKTFVRKMLEYKMLMKLTPIVNFINVFMRFFHTKVVFGSFF